MREKSNQPPEYRIAKAVREAAAEIAKNLATTIDARLPIPEYPGYFVCREPVIENGWMFLEGGKNDNGDEYYIYQKIAQ